MKLTKYKIHRRRHLRHTSTNDSLSVVIVKIWSSAVTTVCCWAEGSMIRGDLGMDFVCVPLAPAWQWFKSWLGCIFFLVSVTTVFLWNWGNIVNTTPPEQWSSCIDFTSYRWAFVSWPQISYQKAVSGGLKQSLQSLEREPMQYTHHALQLTIIVYLSSLSCDET